jgi:hypothetical protein
MANGNGKSKAATLEPAFEGVEMTPLALQRHAIKGAPGDGQITVRLYINGNDDDAVRFFDESLPTSIVRAIISPEVADFYIPIEGRARMKPPRAKAHFLHTSSIRELVLLDELPEEE